MTLGRPKKWKSAKELQALMDDFFDDCKKEGYPPTVEGLCVFLRCDKQTILNYQEKDEFADIIYFTKMKIASHVMGRAMKGEINPTIAIWISKNHYEGYEDKSKTELTSYNYNAETSKEDLEKIKNALGFITESE